MQEKIEQKLDSNSCVFSESFDIKNVTLLMIGVNQKCIIKFLFLDVYSVNSQAQGEVENMPIKGRGLLRPIFGPRIWLKSENWLISIILYFLY